MRTRRLAAPTLLAAGLAAAFAAGPAPATAQATTPDPLVRLFTTPTSRFVHVSSYDTTGGNRDRYEIAPGDSAVLLDLDGPGVVRRLWLTVASDDPHYLRRIALEMFWDGETNPSVRVPLGDFFGNAFDRRHYAALPMGVSSGGFYAYLPLPFARHARIVARNGTGRSVDAFYFNADVELVDALPTPLATFHATWNRDPRTTADAPHRVLRAVGAGHFVGLNLQAESHDGSLGFLEGDEIFRVDGAFRGQGTGTEDYFNSGWYFDQGEYAAPYHGLVVKDDARARIAAYRWHLPDPVPFHDSIDIELEHGHANTEVADYATTAYWYQVEPHRPLPELPPPVARRVLGQKIPTGATVPPALDAGTEGSARTLRILLPRPDRYRILLYPTGGPDEAPAYARVEGGRSVEVALGAAERATVLPPVVLDTVRGSDQVRIDWRRERGAPPPLPAAAEARPVRAFARSWRVVGPFPNPQRLGTEHSPALDETHAPERDPDATGYTLPDGGRVSWKEAEAGEDGYVRLNALFEPNDWVAAYAQAFLWAPAARDAVLLLGADDAHTLWVNGRAVSTRQGRNVSEPDDLAVPVRLERGWNRVLLEVADLDGGWGFHLRAADPSGELRWARTPG